MHPYYEEDILANDEASKEILAALNGPATIWLRIETYAYYDYVGASIFYILWIECRGFYKNDRITDLNK